MPLLDFYERAPLAQSESMGHIFGRDCILPQDFDERFSRAHLRSLAALCMGATDFMPALFFKSATGSISFFWHSQKELQKGHINARLLENLLWHCGNKNRLASNCPSPRLCPRLPDQPIKLGTLIEIVGLASSASEWHQIYLTVKARAGDY